MQKALDSKSYEEQTTIDLIKKDQLFELVSQFPKNLVNESLLLVLLPQEFDH